VLFHQIDAFLIDENPMLNRINSCTDCILDRDRRMRVGRNLPSQAMSFGDQDVHLGRAVLFEQGVVSFGKDSPGGAELNYVRAVLEHFADAVHYSLFAISHTFCRVMELEGEKIVVAMSARNTQRWAGDLHAGSDHVAVVNGIAKCYVGVPLRTDVAHCRKPCHQGETRVFAPIRAARGVEIPNPS